MNSRIDLPNEIWRAIPEYEGFYEASNLGRIWSVERLVSASGKAPFRHYLTGRFPALFLKDGYLTVTVSRKGERKTVGVHILVCRTFHGREPAGREVGHRDGIRTNNSAENIRWVTRQDQCADKREHGTLIQGEDMWCAKLSEVSVIDARKRRANGESVKDIAADYGINGSTMSRALRGITWAHIALP